MRQTGFLAASAAYALTHNFPQLPRVHGLAKKLEAGFEKIGITLLSRAETCMVGLSPSSESRWELTIHRSYMIRPPWDLGTTRSRRGQQHFPNRFYFVVQGLSSISRPVSKWWMISSIYYLR